MAKALGTLIFRGIVGVMSIATTAVITVLVQHYLYGKTGMPVRSFVPQPRSTSPLSAPPPSPTQAETSPLAAPSPAYPADSTDLAEDGSTGTTTSSEPEAPGDRPTQIMEQFWDKLNH